MAALFLACTIHHRAMRIAMQKLCQKCGSEPTIKAHIIPQSVLRAIRTRGTDTKILGVKQDRAIPIPNQNGIYDSGILCDTCDAIIGQLDKWFAESIDQIHRAALSGNDPLFELDIDPELAIRFAVSVVYRATLSTRSEFSEIDLGPYLRIAEEISFSSQMTDTSAALVMISVLRSEKIDPKQFVFLPLRCSGSNGPYFIFNISGIQFLVKFGGKHPRISDDDAQSPAVRIRSSCVIRAIRYPFEKSAEAQFLAGVAERSRGT